MKYLSVCSGIEAASVAFKPLGWEPLAFSEIEAFPRAVLQHHYPDTPLHGDFTELHSQPWIVDADLLCGGTPCQSFSVAGLRKSMGDDRGNLTLQFIKLADAIDDLRRADGREPAFILWENVPGIFSTHDNAFGAFLGGLCGRDAAIPEPADGWPSAGVVDGPTRVAAWRVLDAQHFGLAQRRKRVFVLAKGGAGKWAAADALLPIIESSKWHPAPSRSKGKGTPQGADDGIAEVVGALTDGAHHGGGLNGQDAYTGRILPVQSTIPEVTRPLTAAMGTKWNGNGDLESSLIPITIASGQANAEMVIDGEPSITCLHEVPIAFVKNQREEVREQDVAGALNAEPGTHQTTYVFDLAQITSKANRSNPEPGAACDTLHQGDAPLLVRMREGKEGGGKGPLVSEDQSLTLATANDQVLAVSMRGRDGGATAEVSEIPSALRASNGGGDKGFVLTLRNSRFTCKKCSHQYGIDDYERNPTCPKCGSMECDDVLDEPAEVLAVQTDVTPKAGEIAFTLKQPSKSGGGQPAAVMEGMAVRRLTPIECARLQGFPDTYLDIAFKGKPATDGHKYKALGNSWAVPCVRYIGERINAVTNNG